MFQGSFQPGCPTKNTAWRASTEVAFSFVRHNRYEAIEARARSGRFLNEVWWVHLGGEFLPKKDRLVYVYVIYNIWYILYMI